MKIETEKLNNILNICLKIFKEKLQDYGCSWRIMRLESITDQILIKVRRIISIQINNKKYIQENEIIEFFAIINYSIIYIMQKRLPKTNLPDKNISECINLYKKIVEEINVLRINKNNDYGDAWKLMRVNSITDIIYQKILRIINIETNNFKTSCSEGVESNYMDIINYCIYVILKINDNEKNSSS